MPEPLRTLLELAARRAGFVPRFELGRLRARLDALHAMQRETAAELTAELNEVREELRDVRAIVAELYATPTAPPR